MGTQFYNLDYNAVSSSLATAEVTGSIVQIVAMEASTLRLEYGKDKAGLPFTSSAVLTGIKLPAGTILEGPPIGRAKTEAGSCLYILKK
tara:strand:+ start:42 stop:308 length:267 start_codon:yes stop_codon:yes gene_type:complete